MVDVAESPYIKVKRTWRGRVGYVILAAGWLGIFTVARILVDGWWSAPSSEDHEAFRILIHAILFACAGAGASTILHIGYMRGIEGAVLNLVRRNQPMARRALLKACRPARFRQAVLLASERLLAAGRLDHSREGYTVTDTTAAPPGA